MSACLRVRTGRQSQADNVNKRFRFLTSLRFVALLESSGRGTSGCSCSDACPIRGGAEAFSQAGRLHTSSAVSANTLATWDMSSVSVYSSCTVSDS